MTANNNKLTGTLSLSAAAKKARANNSADKLLEDKRALRDAQADPADIDFNFNEYANMCADEYIDDAVMLVNGGYKEQALRLLQNARQSFGDDLDVEYLCTSLERELGL